MARRLKPIESGTVFKKLTVISTIEPKDNSPYEYNVVCECGNKSVVRGDRLKSGKTKSCGCLRGANMLKHGKYKLKAYMAWYHMIERCYNKKSSSYRRWGGRGITVSDSWRSLDNFLNDMGEPEKCYSLDRIDNDKGYSKENCRWATNEEQAQNRRTSIQVTINGKTASVSKHCRDLGLHNRLIYKLIKKGLSPENAFIKAKEMGLK